MTRGIYYIAINTDIYWHLVRSIETVRKLTNLPIAIATDCHAKAVEMGADIIIDIPSEVPGKEGQPAYPNQGYFGKVYWMSHSPFDETLFLDHDTYLVSDVTPALDLLERFDICAAPDVGRQDTCAPAVPKAMTMFNTGVLAYKNNFRVTEFLRLWWELLDELDNPWGDQPMFMTALWQSPDLNMGTLLREWNFRFIYPQSTYGPVVVLHGRHDALPKIAREINEGFANTGRFWYIDKLVAYYDNYGNFIYAPH